MGAGWRNNQHYLRVNVNKWGVNSACMARERNTLDLIMKLFPQLLLTFITTIDPIMDGSVDNP